MPVSSKYILDFQATTKSGFSLILDCDIIGPYSQMHGTDKYSQYSSIIWPVSLNPCVFVYELSGYGFESRRSHLTFRLLPAPRKELLVIQTSIECRLSLKRVGERIGS